jgi:hypothetical protein
MDKKEQDDLILKGARWGAKFADAVRDAGGYVPGVLQAFSDESVITMVRNGLFVKGDK